MPKFTKQLKNTIDYIYNSLKASGYDDISIAGILGNALTESSLNPDSVSASKTFHGLFLNDKNIRQAVIDKYGDYSAKSQMKYAHDWVMGADWVKANAYTTTNAGKFKRTGYKDAHEASDAWSHLYERAIIKDKNGKVVGYQKDPERRSNATAMYDYINANYNGGIKVLKDDTGGKRMIIPLSEYKNSQYEPENKPYVRPTTIYPLGKTLTPESLSSWNGADAPNANYVQTDFRDLYKPEDYQGVLNQGITVKPSRSPFNLSLSLPSLDSMMLINSPLKLAELYVADILGTSDLLQYPLIFPRFKNGKLPTILPRYSDGTDAAIALAKGGRLWPRVLAL